MNSQPQVDTIAQLDLNLIKLKLMHKESGEGWSAAQADAAEFEYRRFLTLMKLFPQEQVSPLFEVDIFWHYHILDTMKYAADCEQIFGYFLHHFPYSGLLGEEDEAHRGRSGDRMQELYEATFGEDYIRPEHAVLAWLPAVPQDVSPSPAVEDGATSHVGEARTAWSYPAVNAQGGTANVAWSYPTINVANSQQEPASTTVRFPTIHAANAQGHTAKTAWSYPAIDLAKSQDGTVSTAARFPTTSMTNAQGRAAKTAWSYPTINLMDSQKGTATKAARLPTINTAKAQGNIARTAWSYPTINVTKSLAGKLNAVASAKAITLQLRGSAQNEQLAAQAA